VHAVAFQFGGDDDVVLHVAREAGDVVDDHVVEVALRAHPSEQLLELPPVGRLG
jgi:hypothetical protein